MPEFADVLEVKDRDNDPVDMAGSVVSGKFLPGGIAATSDGQVVTKTNPAPVGDAYNGGEVLAEQSGAGAVLTFTFSAEVEMVVIESAGTALVSRADPFGGTPAASTGIPCRDEVPVYVPIRATVVKVYAPIGTAVNVWGYRY